MDAVANGGALFMEFGRKAEAARAMEEAAMAFPHAPGILFSQTDLKRFEPGDPLIGQMQALLSREGISLSDRATLHFGLGKASLDMSDSEKAFRHITTKEIVSSARPIPTMRTLTNVGWRAWPRFFQRLCSPRKRTWARALTCLCLSWACPGPAQRWSSRSSRRIPWSTAQASSSGFRP
jgi:hypothetical protein